jgi:glycosyltransferase involved in cell wall biosynthesis
LAVAAAETEYEHVWIPTGDSLAQWLSLRGFPGKLRSGQIPVSGLLMRGSFAYPLSSWWRRGRALVTERLLLRLPWHRLNFLDPLVVQHLKMRYPTRSNHVGVMPEPIEPAGNVSKEAARQQLGIPIAGRILACAGRMDSRKGIDLLIRAFARARKEPDHRLLLIGRQSPEVRALIEQESALVASQQLLVRDQFADQATFEAVFAAADMVVLPYPEHVGSSGILLRAVRWGKPVLASEWGWIGWVTRNFELGRTVPVRDLARFAAALEAAYAAPLQVHSPRGRQHLMDFHTVENFQAHWLQTLGRHSPDLRPWEPFPDS